MILRRFQVMLCVLSFAIAPGLLQAQDARLRQREELASPPKALPSDVLRQVQVLGARLKTTGKEETVFDGQLVDESGRQKAVRVVHQLSGMVRVENIAGQNGDGANSGKVATSAPPAFSFDGDRTSGSADRVDEVLLHTFVMDSPEAMIYSLRSGASMQLLGRGFGPDPRIEPNYKGPRYDIYEIAAPERGTNDPAIRTKRYYFDSNTGLLASTRYADARGSSVETRFSDWRQVDGSNYPGKIERYENGSLNFSFTVGTVAARARQDAAKFQ